jgi:hypothetical protein
MSSGFCSLQFDNFYGFCEPLVAGDSVFDCRVFGATLLPATPIRISRAVKVAATTPNTKADLLPPFEPSSMSVTDLSAMAISPISFCQGC